jgi:hypothetical protein
MSLLEEYVFGVKDAKALFRFCKKRLQKANKNDFTKAGTVSVAIGLMIGVLGFGFTGIFFWTLFLTHALWKLDSRTPIVFALIGLVIIPCLLALHQHNFLITGDLMAEAVAVWVYFFLVTGVSLQIIELIREKPEAEQEQDHHAKS